MTPAERALLVAIARVACDLSGDVRRDARLRAMIKAVEREEARRPYSERMPDDAPEEPVNR